MGRGLIWIESLVTVFVLLALVTAWTARWTGRRRQRFVAALVALAFVILAAGITWFCGVLKFSLRYESMPFLYLLSWTLALSVGAVIVLVGGLRERGEIAVPAARSWPRGTLAVALGALVIVSCITIWNLDLAVKVQLASMRAEAGAMVLALLPPRVPDRENAALVYEEAFALLVPSDTTSAFWKKIESDVASRRGFSATAFDPHDKNLHAFLQTQERGLALLRKAAAMRACAFQYDYSLQDGLLLPELQRLRRGSMLLAYDAVSKAADGNRAGAMEDVAAIFGIARQIDFPILLSMLTAIAIEKTGARALEGVLAFVPAGPEDRAHLSLNDAYSYRRSLQRACQTEEVILGLPCFAMTATPESARDILSVSLNDVGRSRIPFFLLFELPAYRVFLLSDDLAAYRQVMKETDELASRPYYESAKGWEELNRSFRTKRRGLLTFSVAYAFVNELAVAAAEGDAAHQLARLALAMTAFRTRNGKYANQLADLVPDFLPSMPLDPFSGQPFRMKRSGNAILLYSMGRDLKNDGGVPEHSEKHDGDLVFRLP